MKILKKVLIAILVIFFALVMIYNIYKFICINILKKDMATINGYVTLEVVSGSMEPTINKGDLIIVDTKIKEYKKNDIVVFYDKEGSFITHRIISINDKEMITKGDNNNTEDEPTSVNKIVGKYVKRINKGQKILYALKSPLVTVLILINGVLICIFVSIDRQGNIVLDEEEKEYGQFKKYLDHKNKNK